LIHFYKRSDKMVEKLCYNRGCGKSYDPRKEEEVCTYHPGAPFFHDAYKGWSCCQNKSTDFTTFLNTPGCTHGKHSSVKPVEPENITGNLTKEEAPSIVEVRAPIPEAMSRPPYSSPMVRLTPTIAGSLAAQVKTMLEQAAENNQDSDEIRQGESCKNNGCKNTYIGVEGDYTNCKHHPGYPVFHEGLKYWSCCQRKTTEFQHFLDQEGCDIGSCKWVKEEGKEGVVNCRFDWHQTATSVTLAIYAKKYDPAQSFVELSPVRLRVHLYFPKERGSFEIDMELRGIIDLEGTSCAMMGTKTEIKMKKAESVSWSKLDIPKEIITKEEETQDNSKGAENQVEALDLDDLDLTTQRYTLSKDAMTKKY